MKYSDHFIDWLVEQGYSHCFFVAGGNIMHLLDSARERMTCVPFVNEIGAAIAAEYFTEANQGSGKKAFVMVTAGPGLTNTVTAIASAWTESRELLVVGGQVKSSDLSKGEVRQRGIQEIAGMEIVKSITKDTLLVDRPVPKSRVLGIIHEGSSPRQGPVFIEMCLDAQAAKSDGADNETLASDISDSRIGTLAGDLLDRSKQLLREAKRPILLLGGGVPRSFAKVHTEDFERLGVPLQTTWNGADRVPSDSKMYFGRPNTWGQRYANILIQQADLIIAVGTRLGMQQTGFAWQEFGKNAQIIHVDIDEAELSKGHPAVDLPIACDSAIFLTEFLEFPWEDKFGWVDYCTDVKVRVPTLEKANRNDPSYVDPFKLMHDVAPFAGQNDVLIPCSSGGAFTVAMQSLMLRSNQKVITNKGMASMGYGLSGAIGASISAPESTTWLFEGDGGFAQNLQELGTVAVNQLNLKMFIFSNNGYASIRMTQRNYFNGAWVGCDASTGLGLPDLVLLAKTYGIQSHTMSPEGLNADQTLKEILKSPGPALIVVPIDPEQTYFPKITSRVTDDGSMASNPLHLMDPPLDDETAKLVFKYL